MPFMMLLSYLEGHKTSIIIFNMSSHVDVMSPILNELQNIIYNLYAKNAAPVKTLRTACPQFVQAIIHALDP